MSVLVGVALFVVVAAVVAAVGVRLGILLAPRLGAESQPEATAQPAEPMEQNIDD